MSHNTLILFPCRFLSNFLCHFRFNSDIDYMTGYKTKTMMCCPIKDQHGSVIGVAQVKIIMKANKINNFEFLKGVCFCTDHNRVNIFRLSTKTMTATSVTMTAMCLKDISSSVAWV